MEHQEEGFNRAAAADEAHARSGASRTDGRFIGEVATGHVPPSRAQGDSSGGEAATRFIKRIYSNTPYRIKIRNYGNGLAEVGWSFISSTPPNKAARGLSTQRDKNEDRAARHAKSRLRQLILSANLTHLLTLTYKENVTDFKRASDDLNRFVRKMKVKVKEWRYVAVAEQQERGAWHWHIAVKGYQDVEMIRTQWREVVGEGNIDVSAPKGSRKDQRLYLVKYLGKYLVKAFSLGRRELNQHRFRASRNIKVVEDKFHIVPQVGVSLEQAALSCLKEEAGAIGFVWNADDKMCGWACSWK